MKNIFDKEVSDDIIGRINKLQLNKKPLWGKMSASKMLAHCNVQYEMVYTDKHKKPNVFMKSMLKLLVKNTVVSEKPYKRNLKTAPQFLKTLGIRVLVAKSYARIFYRNSFNIGLPALVCPDADKIEMGDELSVEPSTGDIINKTKGETYSCQPIPAHLMTIVEAGGLMPYLEARLKKSA